MVTKGTTKRHKKSPRKVRKMIDLRTEDMVGRGISTSPLFTSHSLLKFQNVFLIQFRLLFVFLPECQEWSPAPLSAFVRLEHCFSSLCYGPGAEAGLPAFVGRAQPTSPFLKSYHHSLQ